MGAATIAGPGIGIGFGVGCGFGIGYGFGGVPIGFAGLGAGGGCGVGLGMGWGWGTGYGAKLLQNTNPGFSQPPRQNIFQKLLSGLSRPGQVEAKKSAA